MYVIHMQQHVLWNRLRRWDDSGTLFQTYLGCFIRQLCRPAAMPDGEDDFRIPECMYLSEPVAEPDGKDAF